jgi:hypothetical protein
VKSASPEGGEVSAQIEDGEEVGVSSADNPDWIRENWE